MISNIPEEIQKIKIGNTPFITVLWYIAIGFVIGGIVTKQIDSNKDITTNKQNITKLEASSKEFTQLEVGGLRADWERENESVHKRLDDLEKKVYKK